MGGHSRTFVARSVWGCQRDRGGLHRDVGSGLGGCLGPALGISHFHRLPGGLFQLGWNDAGILDLPAGDQEGAPFLLRSMHGQCAVYGVARKVPQYLRKVWPTKREVLNEKVAS